MEPLLLEGDEVAVCSTTYDEVFSSSKHNLITSIPGTEPRRTFLTRSRACPCAIAATKPRNDAESTEAPCRHGVEP